MNKLPPVWLCKDSRGRYMLYTSGRICIFNHIADARDAAKNIAPDRKWRVIRGTVTVSGDDRGR